MSEIERGDDKKYYIIRSLPYPKYRMPVKKN